MLNVMLDMDGCVSDFVWGVLRLFRRKWPYDEIHGDDAWDLPGILGLSGPGFWEPMGHEFWEKLPKTNEADKIVSLISQWIGRDKICFLTSPCKTAGCMEGKLEWVRQWYPDIPILFSCGAEGKGPPKHVCASSHSILIDDHSDNVDAFREAGGNAFLVSRPWNRDWHHEEDLLERLSNYLESFSN